MSKIRPVPGSIAVKRDEVQRKSPGGILLPDKAVEELKRESRTGTIIAVGGDKVNEHGVVEVLGFEVGQRIMFGAFAGSDIDLDGEKIVVMTRGQVMGIIED